MAATPLESTGQGLNRAAILPVALAVAYPLFSHASVLLHAPFLQWLALCCMAAVPLANALLAARPSAWLLFIVIAGLLWWMIHLGDGQYMLYLPPLVLNGAAAALFGLSLRPGHTPLITSFARIARGGVVPPDMLAYCRKLTCLWALMMGGIFAVSLYLTVFGPLWLWSWHTNCFSYVLIAAVFVGEFFLRRRLFAHHPHIGFWDYLKLMTRIRAGEVR